MAEALYRQWVMLGKIPRAPRRIDTAALQRHLADEGYEVTRRTIQRDLQKLSGSFPLMCDDDDPQHLQWYWMEDGKVMDLPGMPPAAAVAFGMARDYLEPLLPSSVLEHLRPYFERAGDLLRPSGSRLSLWPDRVRVIARGPNLKPPRVETEVQDAVYEALLANQALSMSYRARTAARATQSKVHPLGLVARQGVIYLVCRYDGFEDVRHLVLHRMRSAEVLAQRCVPPKGFDLDAHLASGAFGYLVTDKPLRVRLRLDKATAVHLQESPLSRDQKWREDGDQHARLDATVPDTQELRWWLLGLGANVEVLGPKKLRDEMRAAVAEMRALYRKR